jgi:hypothetical protein
VIFSGDAQINFLCMVPTVLRHCVGISPSDDLPSVIDQEGGSTGLDCRRGFGAGRASQMPKAYASFARRYLVARAPLLPLQKSVPMFADIRCRWRLLVRSSDHGSS